MKFDSKSNLKVPYSLVGRGHDGSILVKLSLAELGQRNCIKCVYSAGLIHKRKEGQTYNWMHGIQELSLFENFSFYLLNWLCILFYFQ